MPSLQCPHLYCYDAICRLLTPKAVDFSAYSHRAQVRAINLDAKVEISISSAFFPFITAAPSTESESLKDGAVIGIAWGGLVLAMYLIWALASRRLWPKCISTFVKTKFRFRTRKPPSAGVSLGTVDGSSASRLDAATRAAEEAAGEAEEGAASPTPLAAAKVHVSAQEEDVDPPLFELVLTSPA